MGENMTPRWDYKILEQRGAHFYNYVILAGFEIVL